MNRNRASVHLGAYAEFVERALRKQACVSSIRSSIARAGADA
ncbi:hypothetical protein [Burkholderia latens]|nr:hypothetical protein [Burkholderia latens]